MAIDKVLRIETDLIGLFHKDFKWPQLVEFLFSPMQFFYDAIWEFKNYFITLNRSNNKLEEPNITKTNIHLQLRLI